MSKLEKIKLGPSFFDEEAFDQADTGAAIMTKPGGQRLRAGVEKLRKALNQQGKVTILSGKDIEEVLADRRKIGIY